MKQLLLLILGLSLAGSVRAQSVAITNTPENGLRMSASMLQQSIPSLPESAPASPLADDIMLSYFDVNGTPAAWQAPLQVNQNLIVLQYAERFTLPTESGKLDSIKVRFSQATGDTVYVYLVGDTVVTLQNGDAHLPTSVFGGIAIPVPLLPQIADQDGWVTITFESAAIPKEFHILVAPRIVVDGTSVTPTSALSVVAVNTPDVTPNTETSRSTFVALTSQGIFSNPMDNFFTVGGEQVGVHFQMQAFVNIESGSVARPATAPAAMFPNPVTSSNMLTIQHNEQINSVRIVNMLGADVQTWSGKSTNVQLSTEDLAKGVYNVIVTTERGTTTEKLVVN